MFHVYGNVGVQALTFVIGAAMAIVPNPRDLSDLLATVKRVKPTFFNGVPTLYIAMLNHTLVKQGEDRFQVDPYLLLRRRAAPRRHQHRFESLTPAPAVVEGYSLTEAIDGAVRQPRERPNKLGSVAHAAA